MNWWTIYDTATGEALAHTSVLPPVIDPGWTVIDHGPNRQDQTNIWDPGTRTWIPRPPDPPGPAADTFTLNGIPPVTWTNMPAAKTPLVGSEQKLPLHGARFGRLQCNVRVAGFAGSVLILQVSLDGVAYVDALTVPLTLGLQASALTPIPEQYQTDVWVRLAGQGGNATVDPQVGLTTLQVG